MQRGRGLRVALASLIVQITREEEMASLARLQPESTTLDPQEQFQRHDDT